MGDELEEVEIACSLNSVMDLNILLRCCNSFELVRDLLVDLYKIGHLELSSWNCFVICTS